MILEVDIHMGNNELDIQMWEKKFLTFTQCNIKNLLKICYVSKYKAIKLLEEKTENICNLVLGKHCSELKRAWIIKKTKMVNWTLLKLNVLLTSESPLWKWKYEYRLRAGKNMCNVCMLQKDEYPNCIKNSYISIIKSKQPIKNDKKI